MVKFLDAVLAVALDVVIWPFAGLTQWIRDRRRAALLEAVYSDIERMNGHDAPQGGRHPR